MKDGVGDINAGLDKVTESNRLLADGQSEAVDTALIVVGDFVGVGGI